MSSRRSVHQVFGRCSRALAGGAVLVAVLAGPVAGAGAAGESLALTPVPGPAPGSHVAAKATGTASAGNVLLVYAERFGSTCGATAFDHRFDLDREIILIGADPANPDPSAQLGAGPFDVLLRWAPLPPSGYRLCGYLYASGSPTMSPPLASASAQLMLVDDGDSDGVPDDVDECPSVPGTGANGCASPATTPVTPVTPGAPVVPAAPSVPAGGLPPVTPTSSDPTGVMKLKAAKGKATGCGAGCVVRTRTVGPFSFSLKVKVSGGKTSGTGSVTLTRKSAQAGKAGKACLGAYTPKFKQTCKKVTWAVGKKITMTGSIATPATVRKAGRPGFGMTATVGAVPVGAGASVYLKSAGGRILPDSNEAACISSARAHAAC